MSEKKQSASGGGVRLRRIKIELNRNALAAVAITGFYALMVLALWKGQVETVKPLITLLEKMIAAVQPNIDSMIVGGGIGAAAGYGIRQVVKNSGAGK